MREKTLANLVGFGLSAKTFSEKVMATHTHN